MSFLLFPLDSVRGEDVESPLTAGGLGESYYLPDVGSDETEDAPVAIGTTAMPMSGLTFYDHGDPTDYEQLMLELVNRARANPGAEAARLGIGLNEGLAPETISDTPKQPLGSHRFLIPAARDHSQWMIDNDVFSHDGAGESTALERVQAAGYYPTTMGENLAWEGTTGTVDPEISTHDSHDALFISTGHRGNICNGDYREIGLGIKLGLFHDNGTNFNALLATQKFGASSGTPWPFVVGVAYYDFNGDGFYDPGEGIGGLDVNVGGGSYFTTTASAGGYTLPRPSSAGVREVAFTDGITEEIFSVNMASGVNHKVDLVLDYTPPALSGPYAPEVGQASHYDISPVPGATSFDVTAFSAIAAAFDGANDLSRVIDGTSGSYSAISTTVKHEGSGAYRFAHPEPVNQTLEYAEEFIVGTSASINFRSRLGAASTDQTARVEVSESGGDTWTSVYSQAGTGGWGESSFQARSASLAAFAGKTVRIRFRYAFTSGSYAPGTSDTTGWFVDAIQFNNIDTLEILDEVSVAPGSTYAFVPSQTGTMMLMARPRNFDRLWPAGPLLEVEATAAGGYAAWAQSWETTGGLAAGVLADAPMGDFSGDGVANIQAYAMGFSPLVPAFGLLPAWVDAGGGQSAFEYTVDTAATGVVVAPELSTDLHTWHSPGAGALGFATADEAVSTDGTVQRRRVVFPDGPPLRVFSRVSVDAP